MQQPDKEPQDQNQDLPKTAQQPDAQGGNKDLIRQALMIVYGDEKTYGALLEMLKASSQNIIIGAAKAVKHIVKKLEMTAGPMNMEQAKQVITILVATVLELSEKAGFAQNIDKDVLQSAVGLAFKQWGEQNPDKIDQQQIESGMNSPEGQQMLSQAQGGSQPAPAGQPMPAEQNTEQKGMLS